MRRPADLVGGELRRSDAAEGDGASRAACSQLRPYARAGLLAHGSARSRAGGAGTWVRSSGCAGQPGRDPLRRGGDAASMDRHRRGDPARRAEGEADARGVITEVVCLHVYDRSYDLPKLRVSATVREEP